MQTLIQHDGALRGVQRAYVHDGGMLLRARRLYAHEAGALRLGYDLPLPAPSYRRDPVSDAGGAEVYWTNGVFPEADVASLGAITRSEVVYDDPAVPSTAHTVYFAELTYTVNRYTQSVTVHYSHDGLTWFEAFEGTVSPGGTYTARAPLESYSGQAFFRVTAFTGSALDGVQGFTATARNR